MVWALLLAFSTLVAASPLTRRWENPSMDVKHAWVEIPSGWQLHSPAQEDHILDMHINLKQDKFDELVEHLYQVSDPAHYRYGNHLSKEEVEALIAPHPTTVSLVDSWLSHHGLNPSRTAAGDILTFSVPVSVASKMLNASYNVYFNPSTDSYVVRTQSYSLPSDLKGHIDVVAPTTYFGTLQAMKKTSFLQPDVEPIDDAVALAQQQHKNVAGTIGTLATVPSSCASTITPACLRALYNSSTYVPAATSKNTLGVAGYLDEFANNADLQTFYSKFRTDASGTAAGKFTTVQVNGGGNDQSDPGTEANLDIQYTEGISFPTPNIYYSTGGSPPFTPDSNTPTNSNEPYLQWLQFILAQTTVPQTFTTSYGDDEQTVPLDYATSVCNLFAQLGARGSSILFSSGDDGVGGGNCVSNDGTNTKKFQPNFPASCPFVTTVGGTTGINPETAVSFSGGGFSNYFAQPSYQSSAVSTFLTVLGSTNSGLFNRTGRAYPDVAAQGQRFQVIIGGGTSSVAGTSASSPTFAGIVALLNDFRISIGKAPLGFLNPFLYSSGAAGLNDITSGRNPGCSTNGFTARAGWDPVTGLGTPDFGKLQAIARNLA